MGRTNETQSEVYTVHYDDGDDEQLSTAVVQAVAAAEGVETHELQVSLFDVVDPDALNDAIQSAGDSPTDCEVSFTLANRRVTVSADGIITVGPHDARDELMGG